MATQIVGLSTGMASMLNGKAPTQTQENREDRDKPVYKKEKTDREILEEQQEIMIEIMKQTNRATRNTALLIGWLILNVLSNPVANRCKLINKPAIQVMETTATIVPYTPYHLRL
ncbi:hypothetical protein [Flavobacterium sp. JP2137]|uniref:hypothetical protein n=1 Tax=Flavobacterium sp. JP2137 TaxID=3414510 RepID=UPI003D2FC694